ncbi:MAG: response regulator [Chthoniobacteraceae bacterium]
MILPAPRRILVIDDNPAIHADFRKIFCPATNAEVDRSEASFFGEPLPESTLGTFEIESAFQGEGGVARLERALAEGRPPSVAFVDVRMPPGIDGIETAERLWKLAPDLQVVICTAYSDYSWEEMIAKLGQRDQLLILKKPFAAIEALQLACALGEKWHMAQTAREHLAEIERVVEERTRELRDANHELAAEIEQRKQAESHLLRAQRLESIGTLAGGLAHDLNNLLSPILVSAQLLRDEWPPEAREEFIATIETSAERAAGIIRQVLTFARGIEGERVPLQPRQLVIEIRKIIGETFPRHINIEIDLGEDLWLIEGDATQLHQVLMNLCVNARDAMPSGGTLRIAAENFEATAHHVGAVVGQRASRCVKLCVSDTGHGIPAEVADRIFDPFYTTKEVGKGTGLGLSTAAGIVKSHGGFIDLRSEPGKGTTFEIVLPAVHDSVPAKVASGATSPAVGNGELILVVDDEDHVRSVIDAALKAHGYRVLVAADGAEGLTNFVARRGEIRAVVTDLDMPFVDGVALCRALRRIAPCVSIVATTGTMDDARELELHALNVRTILPKPFPTNALLGALQDAIESGESAVVSPVPMIAVA